MKVIEKFVCEKCNKEYYDKLSAEKCELEHKQAHALGAYLTHTGKVASSVHEAIDHVVVCDWCKERIKTDEWVEKRDMALQRAANAIKYASDK